MYLLLLVLLPGNSVVCSLVCWVDDFSIVCIDRVWLCIAVFVMMRIPLSYCLWPHSSSLEDAPFARTQKELDVDERGNISNMWRSSLIPHEMKSSTRKRKQAAKNQIHNKWKTIEGSEWNTWRSTVRRHVNSPAGAGLLIERISDTSTSKTTCTNLMFQLVIFSLILFNFQLKFSKFLSQPRHLLKNKNKKTWPGHTQNVCVFIFYHTHTYVVYVFIWSHMHTVQNSHHLAIFNCIPATCLHLIAHACGAPFPLLVDIDDLLPHQANARFKVVRTLFCNSRHRLYMYVM